MKLLYVIYREDIFSPLVEGQVLNVLSEFNKKIEVHLLWIKRADYNFKFKEKIKKVKQKLESNGIVLHELSFIIGKFPLSERMTRLGDIQTIKRVKKIIKDNEIDIVHTRGYNAGLLISKIKKQGGRFKHVFDPRSPYLTEIQSTYKIQPNSKKYYFWEKSEKEILSTSDATIAVSHTFEEYLSKECKNVYYIPNNSKIDNPKKTLELSKQNRRNSLCFVGSIGSGWNNVDTYFDFINKVNKIDETINYEFYVLEKCYETVLTKVKESGISIDKFVIKSLPPSEINYTIAGCIGGLQIMSMKDTRLGIKTVDYLAAGVPIICNSNAMGAADLLKKEEVGWNIDEVEVKEIIEKAKEKNISEKCIYFAYNNFSTKKIAEKYKELYYELVK